MANYNFLEEQKETESDFQKYLSEFKGLISRYDKFGVLHACSLWLFDPPELLTDSGEIILDCDLFLTVKFALLYGRENGKDPTFLDLKKIIELIKKAFDTCLPEFEATSKEYGILKQARRICFQQFWYRNPINIGKMIRPYIMFNKLCKELNLTDFPTIFEKCTGLSLTHFLELAFMLHIYGKQNPKFPHFPSDYFDNCTNHYGEKTLNNFLNLVTIEEEKLTEYIESQSKYVDLLYQGLEQTPMRRYPLIYEKGKKFRYSLSPHLLDEIMRAFPMYTFYNLPFPSKTEKSKVQVQIGEIYEEYLKIGLNHWGIKYYREKEIKKEFRISNKLVDYIVPIYNCTLLIEAKSTELNRKAKTLPTDSNMREYLKNDLIHAIEQMYETANSIKNGVLKKSCYNSKTLFGLIVTYDDYYLPDAHCIYQEFLKEHIDVFLSKKKIDFDIIDLRNIFIISIDGFDRLIEIFSRKSVTPKNLFFTIREKNKNCIKNIKPVPEKMAFKMGHLSFDFHLDRFQPNLTNLPYLDNSYDQLTESLITALQTKPIME